jgi:hypothetical protein
MHRWMRRISGMTPLATVFLALVLALVPVRAGAQQSPGGEIFTVRGVPLDETAANASEARASGLAKGQREAFDRLVARLTRSVFRNRLADIDPSTLGFLVESLQIANEKTSDVRYLAELTVRFKPDAVRGLFRSAGIPYAEVHSGPVVVIPVIEEAGQYRLWEDPNPWREAWRAYRPDVGLVPVVAPVGDLSDIVDLSTQAAIDGQRDAVGLFLERYRAETAMVAIASLEAAPLAPMRVTVTGTRIGVSAPPLIVGLTAGEDEGRDALLRRAVGVVVDILRDDWIASNAVSFDASARLRAAVPLRSLADWIAVRLRLERVPSVLRVVPVALTADSAEVALDYSGSLDQLARTLARFDLAFEAVAAVDGGDRPVAPADAGDAALPTHVIHLTDG